MDSYCRVGLAIFMAIVATACTAEDYFVAVGGREQNLGTEDSPWDIESAWGGRQQIEPGSTLYMLGGTYRHPERSWTGGSFELLLSGNAQAPIHIRPLPGERVTIDGTVVVTNGASHLWLWDLEITVSETANWDRRVPHAGADPRPHRDLPGGGLVVHGGRDSKFINLLIHSTAGTGVSFWRGAVDAELHGCLIFDNGLIATDRYHGPGIYTQNEHGQKWITDNVLWGNYSTTIQAYGSDRAYVNGFRIIGNVSFGSRTDGGRQGFLIGGGRPSEDIVVRENILHRVPLQIGYTAPHNEDAVVRDNVIIDAGLSINRFRQVDQANNRVVGDAERARYSEPEVWLRPNQYDRDRANLAIANWSREATLEVNLESFLRPGDSYRLVSVLDFFGPPVAKGIYHGGRVMIPVAGSDAASGDEFAVYVLFRE
jgi:hypothetical protein